MRVEGAFIAADPDREFARGGAGRAATDRRIQHVRTLSANAALSFFTMLGALVERSK